MNKNENVVIAVFVDDHAADRAVVNLRDWDKRVDEVKLGAIGKVSRNGDRLQTKVVHTGFFNRALPIPDQALTTLGNELSGDYVAVVVAVDDYEAQMVTDSLVRDGGRLLVNTSVKTPEEIAAEQKAVGEALFEDAVEKTSEKNTRPSTYNINKPM